MNWSIICFIGAVYSHAHMFRPAAEGTAANSGNDIARNYDINSPVGSARYNNPCGHSARGNPVEEFTAGQNIPVQIGGSAFHGGGHCQFGFSYDRKNFAVTHTVTGTCPLATNYTVPIPKNAPNGVVTFIWGWNNKVGMREMYISCAEINIVGGQDSGSIDGKELLVSNIQGAPNPNVFPAENFSKELGDTRFNEQKPISVSPSGTRSNKNKSGSDARKQKESTQKKQEQQYDPKTNAKKESYGNDNRYYKPDQLESRFGTDEDDDQNLDYNSEINTNNDINSDKNTNDDYDSSRKFNNINAGTDQSHDNYSPKERTHSWDDRVNNDYKDNQDNDRSYENQQEPDYTPDSQDMDDQNMPPKVDDQSSGNRGRNGMDQVKERAKAQCKKSGCTGWNIMYNPLKKDYDFYTY